MMTALTVSDRRGRGIGRLLRLMRSNRIRVEHRYCDTAALKIVTYEQFRPLINWGAVDRFVKSSRREVLCAETLELPAESGYKRFEGCELSRRLCTNTALMLLDHADDRLATVLYDPDASFVGFCRYLLCRTDRLTVVTDARGVYLDEAEHLLEEKGAVLRISSGRQALTDAGLIIAPGRLGADLCARSDALILSGSPPTVHQNAPVISRYLFELPEKYRRLKPDFLDEMYFAEALYTLAHAYELGSYRPRFFSDNTSIHTAASLCSLLPA